jgi:hypothetical protein
MGWLVVLIWRGVEFASTPDVVASLEEQAFLVQMCTIVALSFLMYSLPATVEEKWKHGARDTELLIPKFDNGWKRTRNATTAAEQVQFFWRSLWMCWIGLYLAFYLKQRYPSAAISFCWDFLNMMNNGLLFLCYYSMIARTTGRRAQGKADFNIFKCALATILVSLGLPFLAFIYPALHKGLPYLAGTLTGMTLALLAGRLEGPLIGPPQSRVRHAVAAGLYVYALVQVVYTVVAGDDGLLPKEEKPWATLITTSIAFAGKLLLYWYVENNLIKDGGLYWYMFAYRKHYDDAGIFVSCQVGPNQGAKELPSVSGIFVSNENSSSPRISVSIDRDEFLAEILEESNPS